MSKKRTKTENRKHNISGKEYLSISDFDTNMLQKVWDMHLTDTKSTNQYSSYLAELPTGLVFEVEKSGRKVKSRSFAWGDGKPCILKWVNGTVATKQKLNLPNKKEVKLHQVAAVLRFGQDRIRGLKAVPSAEDYLISHTCGVEYCGEGAHLVLEPKWTNDERQKCHFIMRSILERGHERAKLKAFGTEYCPHIPRCGEDNSRDHDLSWDMPSRDKSLRPARDEFIKIIPTHNNENNQSSS